jgi:Ca2+-binding RTX toxin-like protein
MLVGCGGGQSSIQEGLAPEAPSPDNDGLAELTRPLDTVGSTDCVFHVVAAAPAIKGQLDLTVGSGKTYTLSKHALNATVLINNSEIICRTNTTSGAQAAVKTADIKAISVVGAGGSETLILDFANGIFGTASATTTGSGITIDSSSGNKVETVKIRTTSSADSVRANLKAGSYYVDLDGLTPADISFGTTTPALTFNFGGGADVFSGAANTTVFGTGAANLDKATNLFGAAGNDTLTGGDVADNIYGGDGDDVVSGGAGDDKIHGGKGNDTLKGDLGNDMVEGEEGNDTIDEGTATSGADQLFGWLNNDPLATGSITDANSDGNPDGVYSSSGTAYGSEPSSDYDTITYAGRTNAITVSPGSDKVGGTTWTFFQKLGDVSNSNATEAAGDCDDGEGAEKDCVAFDFDYILGGSGNDTFYSGPGGNATLAETFKGNDGDDKFYASFVGPGSADGSDTFVGGNGTDTVSYMSRATAVCVTIAKATSAAADRNDGTASTCTLTSSSVNGVLTIATSITSTEKDDVQVDIETVEGGAGADKLVGNDLNNTLRGQAGADTLAGQGGDDVFDEAYGTDVDGTTANTDNGDDVFYGGTGTADRVDYSSRTVDICATIATTDTAPFTRSGEGGTINTVGGGAASINCTGVTEGAGSGDIIRRDVEGVTGGSGDDFLVGNDQNNILDGNAGTNYAFCGDGQEDIAYKATDVGYDMDESNTNVDSISCEL